MQNATPGPNGQTTRHYGKYRGIVTDNADPKKLGRLKARVPEVLGDVETGWALPCAPYAGHQSGTFAVPSAGTGVWMEFESGDVSSPIWAGCWWGDGDVPTDKDGADATPDVKIIRSETGLLVSLSDADTSIAVSDKEGQNLLNIQVQQGKIILKAATLIQIDAPEIQLVSGATQPLAFGNSLLTYLNSIVQTFNAHLHPGEMAIGVLPVTPAPPVAPMMPPTPDLLSQKVKTG